MSRFGEVESVRLRSVAVEAGKLPRKAAIASGRVAENRGSAHAYIVFKSEDSMGAAVQLNMSEVCLFRPFPPLHLPPVFLSNV